MRKSLIRGASGRVLVDRNLAFHFLDESSFKRNRQIRLIRNIGYQLEYFIGHVSHDVIQPPAGSAESEEEVFERKSELSNCGKNLKPLSPNLVAVARDTAREQNPLLEVRLSLIYSPTVV